MDILFAVMPFADVSRPAIGVSLLHSAARQRGYSSRVEYFNIDLAEIVGLETYGPLTYQLPPDVLAGEWFFADLVFGDALPPETEFLSKVLATCASAGLMEMIVKARRHRAAFIDDCVRRIRAQRPRIVGFTTTFHQTCACLAVAKRLKEADDPPIIVFGGANCEGDMGAALIGSFPWIDYVCSGEGDLSFPLFLEHLDDSAAELPSGFLRRGDAQPSHPPLVQNLDELPIPDYADYFDRITASPLRPALQVTALIETSRGCWWGAKHHCTFCGLNGHTMAFRSKSADRALSELKAISARSGVRRIDCVDNILDVRYIQSVFPRLASNALGLELFYEVKANLRFDQLMVLRAGGMRQIQPGIESFDNGVLRLMKKGCTGLQNISLLRWCEELGIDVIWNLLAGFPGETADDYRKQADLVRLLTHLPPPASCSPIRLDRFSPLYVNASELGLTRVRPAPAYYYVFPLGRSLLARLAYFFDFDYADGARPISYVAPLQNEVHRWNAAHFAPHPARLDAQCSACGIEITDTREIAVGTRHRLSGLAAKIYLRCDSGQTSAGLAHHFGQRHAAEIDDILQRLVATKLMIEADGLYLSLAVMRNRAAAQALEQVDAA